MLVTLKKNSPFIIAALTIFAASCSGIPGTGTNGTDTGVASIAGKVTKDDGSAANNATVVLIEKNGDNDTDAQIVLTDSSGNYSFKNVSAGNYRVAFVVSSEQERKNKSTIVYDPSGKTGLYFGAITTKAFDYSGSVSSTSTFTVPTFNVGWTSNLKPNNDSFSSNTAIPISWSSVNDGKVKSYNVVVKDNNDNQVFKSDNNSNTSVTIPSGTLPAGKYVYIVNVNFDFDAADTNPVLTYGNSPNGQFTVN